MATYSTSLQIKLITDGTESGTWGSSTNTNWNLMEQAVAGVQAITMVNADYTLSVLNGASDEARNMVLAVGGSNTAIRKIVAPLVPKVYVVFNNTSGGYAITIGGSTGTVVTVPNGASVLVYCDGTNFYGGVTGTTGNWAINGNLTASGSATITGAVTGASFSGAGTGLTGTASSLSIGGNAATATSATSATSATTATTATTANALNTGNSYTGVSFSDSIGNVRNIPINNQTSSYTLQTSDSGKCVSITTGGVIVPASIFSAGQVITVYNNSGSSQTITQGSGATLQWTGQTTSTTGDRTLALYSVATILCIASNSFIISGNGLT
jgi:hypothetical protein